ncbi:MAG TPA: hypothetical protein VJ063_06000, partial [Verrucomicrobiae bacterium]|nr:hypothetical protein [Verrucomicrobiae bacterium]
DCGGRAKRRDRLACSARRSQSAVYANPDGESKAVSPLRSATAVHSARFGAFTVIELIVVISIIAALMIISLPALKGITQAHTVSSASQQLMDDLALARQYAINNRAYVHVLFIPPAITNIFRPGMNLPPITRRLTGGAFSTYAFYADRTVGDQPGQHRARYIGKWKSLPQGVFIAPSEFNPVDFRKWETLAAFPVGRPFAPSPNPAIPTVFPFPTLGATTVELPHITFSPQGSCVFLDADNVHKPLDEVIELARGSILAARDNNGDLLYFDVRESPPNNSVDNYNRIRIDGLTGRCTLERPELP